MKEKDNQINELEFQLRYVTRLKIDEDYEINKADKSGSGHISITALKKISQETILQEERINNIDCKSFKSPLTLKFKLSYLLFGIPFFIDLYKISQQLKRYTQDLVKLFYNDRSDLAKYREAFDEKKKIKEKIRNKSIDDMQNENVELNENECSKDKNVSMHQSFTDDSYISDGNDYDNEFGTDQYKNFLISKDNQIRELKVKLKDYVKSQRDDDR